jgi:hypothetical protein
MTNQPLFSQLNYAQPCLDVSATVAPTVRAFVEQLMNVPKLPNLCNPWKDSDVDLAYDIDLNAAFVRRMQLMLYLNQRLLTADKILIAEAPGYQGARFSGIPMTSERMLLGHHASVLSSDILNGTGLPVRTSCLRLPRAGLFGMNEPTATVVWSHLLQSGFDSHSFVLWNTVAFHPYQMNNAMSNRTPTPQEINALSPLLHSFLGLFPKAKIIALGKIAYGTLTDMGINCMPVRHPSMGGANQFRQQLQALANQ